MWVELKLRGGASRLVNIVFDGYDVTIDGSDTVICGAAKDEIDALGLIERARNVGFTVVHWRMLDQPSTAD